MEISFVLNGKTFSVDSDPRRRLIDVLRLEGELTGVKEGCGEGECGACSIFLNGVLVNSCLIPVGSVDGDTVETIEGIRETSMYKVLEDSFQEAGAVQCGFCIPGMIMASVNLLRKNPHPDSEAIKTGLAGNLCRCTGYKKIIEGVKKAAALLDR